MPVCQGKCERHRHLEKQAVGGCPALTTKEQCGNQRPRRVVTSDCSCACLQGRGGAAEAAGGGAAAAGGGGAAGQVGILLWGCFTRVWEALVR